MNRRGFLGALAGTVGGVALNHAVACPFRVYSFPSEIVVPPPMVFSDWVSQEALRILVEQLQSSSIFLPGEFDYAPPIGQTITIRMPLRKGAKHGLTSAN